MGRFIIDVTRNLSEANADYMLFWDLDVDMKEGLESESARFDYSAKYINFLKILALCYLEFCLREMITREFRKYLV